MVEDMVEDMVKRSMFEKYYSEKFVQKFNGRFSEFFVSKVLEDMNYDPKVTKTMLRFLDTGIDANIACYAMKVLGTKEASNFSKELYEVPSELRQTFVEDYLLSDLTSNFLVGKEDQVKPVFSHELVKDTYLRVGKSFAKTHYALQLVNSVQLSFKEATDIAKNNNPLQARGVSTESPEASEGLTTEAEISDLVNSPFVGSDCDQKNTLYAGYRDNVETDPFYNSSNSTIIHVSGSGQGKVEPTDDQFSENSIIEVDPSEIELYDQL